MVNTSLGHRLRAALAVSTAVVAVGAGLTPPASASGSVAVTPHITAVRFSGTSGAPTVTITGSGFGARPKRDPAISPAKAGAKYGSACNTQALQGNKKDGSDYGPTALGLGWGTSTPTGYGAGVYVAGSYIDCIGVVIKRYSASRIVLTLGCQYALYSKVLSGDDYLVQVAGVTKAGIVSY